MTDLLLLPTPCRAFSDDDPAHLLEFAIEAYDDGPVALATLVEIRGGAARSLGSHVVVASDGRYCGYVSGGCVEAAVAAEALIALHETRDRVVRFGEGSSFIDIALPCGGGISVAIHVLRDITPLQDVVGHLSKRKSVALAYVPEQETLSILDDPGKTGWFHNSFTTYYRPRTRLVISGRSGEVDALANLAEAARYDVIQQSGRFDAAMIDQFTAVVLLHHDLDAETVELEAALRSPAFYIGALGSTRTHHARTRRLMDCGFSKDTVERIRGPIGIFGPARDLTSLSISIIADVASVRLKGIDSGS